MGIFHRSKSNPNTASSNDDHEDPQIPPMEWPEEPEMNAGLLNGFVFLWIQPMFSRAAYLRKHGKWLEQNDLAPLPAIDRSEAVEDIFEKAYKAYVPKKNEKKRHEKSRDGDDKSGVVSDSTSAAAGGISNNGENPQQLESRLIHALIATCKQRLIVGGLYRFLNTCLQFSFPILLNLILSYFQDVQSGVIGMDDPPMVRYRGYWLSALLMAFVMSKAITESAYFHKMNRCSWR